MIDRRLFLKTSAAVATCSLVSTRLWAEAGEQVQHVAAERAEAALTRMQDFKRRASFGWQVAGIPGVEEAKQSAVEVHWSGVKPAGSGPARLRLCVLDTREPKTPVEARLLTSQTLLGTFDLQWVGQFQVFEIPLTAEQAKGVLQEGIQLRQTVGKLPVWILTDTGSGPELPDALRPHLLFEQASDPYAEYFRRMNSLACVQPFGWMEGCVLDGLRDLAAIPRYAYLRNSLEQHLALWFKPDGQLIYENPRGEPVDNRTNGVESTLPFAVLAWENPEHPALEMAIKYWKRSAHPESGLLDHTRPTTEGAYTVGYPAAVAAVQRQDQKLAELALRQVLRRQELLFDGKTLSRYVSTNKDGKTSYGNRNWCRGIAWQMLGLVRTLSTLQEMVDTTAGQAAVAQTVEWIAALQLSDGLWSVFVHEPKLTPDTSGSAGIASALALAVNAGWADEKYRQTAVNCLDGLKPHLTADGFLTGAAQSNKGGEQLQRGNYRVIYQMGMGLMGQLIAALETENA